MWDISYFDVVRSKCVVFVWVWFVTCWYARLCTNFLGGLCFLKGEEMGKGIMDLEEKGFIVFVWNESMLSSQRLNITSVLRVGCWCLRSCFYVCLPWAPQELQYSKLHPNSSQHMIRRGNEEISGPDENPNKGP